MLHAFFGPVVEVCMRKYDLASQGVDVDTVIVVLRGDLDPAGPQVLHRMVSSVMAEFQFVGLSPKCKAKYLMAKTDAEYRFFPKQFLRVFDRIGDGLGVTRT